MHYDRKIKYLELVEQGESLQSTGFVKLEIRESRVSMQIKVEKLKVTDTGDVQVILLDGTKRAVLGNLCLEQGRGSIFFEEMDSKDMAGGIGYDDLEEIWVFLQENRYLRCRIKEKEQVRAEEKVLEVVEPEIEEAEVEKAEPEVLDIPMQQPELGAIVLEAPLEEERGEAMPALQMPREEYKEPNEEVVKRDRGKPAATKWQQLWEMYPHTRPFEDQREYLRLKPEDLVVLSAECYPLVSNSFLLHGFYNYQHLILTKELVRGQEQYYIGAPGNFYAKEKQVAILFGFESFEGKVEPAQNGDFGYYMIPVEI